jgi:hypothetical protein
VWLCQDKVHDVPWKLKTPNNHLPGNNRSRSSYRSLRLCSVFSAVLVSPDFHKISLESLLSVVRWSRNFSHVLETEAISPAKLLGKVELWLFHKF